MEQQQEQQQQQPPQQQVPSAVSPQHAQQQQQNSMAGGVATVAAAVAGAAVNTGGPLPAGNSHSPPQNRISPMQFGAAMDLNLDNVSNGPTDLDETNLYVKGLWKDCTQVELDDLFKQFGVISQSRVYGDGVGFVRFETGPQAHKAIKAMNGKRPLPRCEEPLLVKLAFRKTRNQRKYIRDVEMIMNKNTNNVYLRCLPRGFGEKDLVDLCSPYGELTCTRLRESGVAFVRFRKSEDATRAIRELNGKTFSGSDETLLAKLANSDPFQPKIGFRARQLAEQQAAAAAAGGHESGVDSHSASPPPMTHNQNMMAGHQHGAHTQGQHMHAHRHQHHHRNHPHRTNMSGAHSHKFGEGSTASHTSSHHHHMHQHNRGAAASHGHAHHHHHHHHPQGAQQHVQQQPPAGVMHTEAGYPMAYAQPPPTDMYGQPMMEPPPDPRLMYPQQPYGGYPNVYGQQMGYPPIYQQAAPQAVPYYGYPPAAAPNPYAGHAQGSMYPASYTTPAGHYQPTPTQSVAAATPATTTPAPGPTNSQYYAMPPYTPAAPAGGNSPANGPVATPYFFSPTSGAANANIAGGWQLANANTNTSPQKSVHQTPAKAEPSKQASIQRVANVSAPDRGAPNQEISGGTGQKLRETARAGNSLQVHLTSTHMDANLGGPIYSPMTTGTQAQAAGSSTPVANPVGITPLVNSLVATQYPHVLPDNKSKGGVKSDEVKEDKVSQPHTLNPEAPEVIPNRREETKQNDAGAAQQPLKSSTSDPTGRNVPPGVRVPGPASGIPTAYLNFMSPGGDLQQQLRQAPIVSTPGGVVGITPGGGLTPGSITPLGAVPPVQIGIGIAGATTSLLSPATNTLMAATAGQATPQRPPDLVGAIEGGTSYLLQEQMQSDLGGGTSRWISPQAAGAPQTASQKAAAIASQGTPEEARRSSSSIKSEPEASPNPHRVDSKIADQIFSVVHSLYPMQAPKLTGMFLHNHDEDRCSQLLKNEAKLREKINELAAILQTSSLSRRRTASDASNTGSGRNSPATTPTGRG